MAVDLDMERELHRAAQPVAPAGSLFETYADKALRRVDDVLAGRGCPWPLKDPQRRFLTLLRSYQGSRRMISLGEICERLKIDPRSAKDIVHELRLSFGVQVGGNRDADAGGYYICTTYEESTASSEIMFRQAVSMFKVVYVMRGGRDNLEELLQQLRLSLTLDQEAPRA